MKKLRIAFNPTGIWHRDEFRLLIKDFVNDTDNFEVYLITQDTSTSFVESVTDESGVDSANVYQVASNDALVQKLDSLKIRIYLDGDNRIVMFVEATSTYAVAILVSAIIDANESQPMYFTKLQFWIKQIRREDNGN